MPCAKFALRNFQKQQGKKNLISLPFLLIYIFTFTFFAKISSANTNGNTNSVPECSWLLTPNNQLRPVTLSQARAGSFELNRQLDYVHRYEFSWNMDGPQWGGYPFYASDQTYDIYFRNALAGMSLDEYLKDRQQKGLPTRVLDLFGPAAFMEDISYVDAMISARLESTKIPGYNSANWSQVTGNYLTTATWNKLRRHLALIKAESLDLIIFRPVGGSGVFYDGTENPDAYKVSFHQLIRLLKNSYNLLNSDNGVMLIVMDKFSISSSNPEKAYGYNKEALKWFFANLTELNIQYETYKTGHDTTGYGSVLKITKTRNSPSKI